MMVVGRIEALYRLQSVEMEIDETRATLDDIQSRLEANGVLAPAQQELQENEEKLRDSRGRLRDLELDLEQLAAKIASTEETLYSGQVTNPKELAGLDQELDYLRRRRSEVEDETLVAMDQAETTEAQYKAAESRLQNVERQWDETQGQLRQEAEELRSRLTALEVEKKHCLSIIPKEDLSIYENRRRRTGGQAVAILKGGICQGCRVALPTSVVQQVRRGQDLVYCGSCQRILYAES
jgi:predicted  nucleic acid-binding Zn-ribbon protein